MFKWLIIFSISFLFQCFSASATDRVSQASGNWSAPGTWNPSGTPVAGDNLTILSGHTVSMNSNPGACTNLTINGTLGCNNARTLNASGNLLINNGATINGGSGTLNVTGTMSVPATATVTVGSVALNISGATTISGRLNISNTTGAKSFAGITVSSGGVWNSTVAENVTVNGSITSSGTWECASGTYSVTGSFNLSAGTANFEGNITGDLNISSGTTFNSPTGILSVAGTTSISGTLRITTVTGTKTFNNITVNSGGIWNSTVAETFTISGNLSSSGTFTSNTGVYTLSGTGKTISGTLSIPSLAVIGTYTNNATFTCTTALTGAGSFIQGTTGTLNIGASNANFSVTTFNASASGNTVSYTRAGIQNIRTSSGGSYHHLMLAGSGTKTLVAVTDINGNVTISSTFASANFNMTVAGNWLNTGSFIAGTATVTLDGAAQSITKSGGETFNNLVISGTGTKTLGSAITVNGNLSINSTLDVSASNFAVTVKRNWINSGTFVYRSGTVTFSGTVAQTIGGSSTTNFYDLTQSNAAGVSLTIAQNLYNSLTVSLGTFTTTGFNFTLVSNASGTARINTIPAGANFAGNIIMQRYTGTGPTDWRFLGSAVSGATIADWADDFATSGFTGSTDPPNSFVSIYSYNEATLGIQDSGFVPATNVTNSISSGKGYWVYLGPTPVTFEVTGPPHTFTVTPAISFTSSAGASQDGWNMIANPYPSAIDWDAAGWTKTNLDNAVYVYNSSTGSFASYVAGIGVNGGSRYIASQQAFWIKANAAGPAVRMVESVKATTNPSYLKAASAPNTSYYPMAFKDFPIPLNANTVPNSLKLTASGNGFDDETLIYFTAGASADYDGGFDAWKMQNLNPAAPNLSSVINDTMDMSINSFPELTADMTVPIRILVQSTGTYSIRRDSTLMLPSSSCIFLEDLANGNMVDLRSVVSYSFTISDTTAAPRFLLHIYAPVHKEAINTNCSNDSSGAAIAKGTGSGPWTYIWKDSSGKVLQTTNSSLQADTLFNLSAGVYGVDVSGTVCGTVRDTIIIRSSSSLQVFVNALNITCNGLNNGAATATVSAGTSPYTYGWSTGETSGAINSLAPGNYSLTVTDAGGCSQIQAFYISQPSILLAGFSASTDTLDLSVNNSVAFTDVSYGATSYSWDFGDTTSLDTSQNPIHYYSASGTYSVVLITSNGTCFDTAYASVVAIDSLNLSSVPFYTSPSSLVVVYERGEVFLSFDLPEQRDAHITVLNALGEKIISRREVSIRKEKIWLPLSEMSSGLYVAAVEIQGTLLTRKILIH